MPTQLKISFTSGVMDKIDAEFYNLTLFNGDKKVYAATLDRSDAAQVINDHKNIHLKAKTGVQNIDNADILTKYGLVWDCGKGFISTRCNSGTRYFFGRRCIW